MEQEITLLIVEDNLEMCEILKDFFGITGEISVCGVAHDGEEALQQIALLEPDVVLLDLIMPKLDGLSVLERLQQESLKKFPCIIVTSAIGQELITNKTLALGAKYYMIKPYNLTTLSDRIKLLLSDSREKSKKNNAPPLTVVTEFRPMIAQILLDLGMSTNLLGYQYCLEAIQILIRENRRCSIVKEIYTVVAEKFDTTPECVESAIRNAIHRVYVANNNFFQELAGTENKPIVKQPSNGKFITLLSEHVRLGIQQS